VNLQPLAAYGDFTIENTAALESLIQNTSLTARTPFETGRRKIRVLATAYSSTPDQTDDTPFTTASNTTVRDGVVASSFLPFGTKLKIPALYGDKIFVVEDSMNRRYQNEYRLDVWHPNRADAKEFGVKKIEVVVL
jgi:3D (Asp-Asp-Asp) domain-containing protein